MLGAWALTRPPGERQAGTVRTIWAAHYPAPPQAKYVRGPGGQGNGLGMQTPVDAQRRLPRWRSPQGPGLHWRHPPSQGGPGGSLHGPPWSRSSGGLSPFCRDATCPRAESRGNIPIAVKPCSVVQGRPLPQLDFLPYSQPPSNPAPWLLRSSAAPNRPPQSCLLRSPSPGRPPHRI